MAVSNGKVEKRGAVLRRGFKPLVKGGIWLKYNDKSVTILKKDIIQMEKTTTLNLGVNPNVKGRADEIHHATWHTNVNSDRYYL